MRAHHTTRLFPWLPIPSQWAGRVLKFTSILFRDIFIKLPSLNCISGLHGFLCLHTIVNRTSYMMLPLRYFAFWRSHFLGGSLSVHPFTGYFLLGWGWGLLLHNSAREFILSLILSLYKRIQAILKKSVQGQTLYCLVSLAFGGSRESTKCSYREGQILSPQLYLESWSDFYITVHAHSWNQLPGWCQQPFWYHFNEEGLERGRMGGS